MVHRFSPKHQSGFTLPVILLISVGLMIVGLSLIQSTSSIRGSLDDQYLNRLSNEAAEAGAVYANYCLTANNFMQTWGPANGKPNLTPKTDCNGDPVFSAPNYVMTNGTFRTSFSVDDLDSRVDGALVISSTGKVERTTGGSNSLERSETNVRKQVVSWNARIASVSSSGALRTCAIVTSELYCWGENYYGQLGDGTTTKSLTPVKVVQRPGILANKVVNDLFAARYHNCAIASKKLYCWGQNNAGQVGDGTTTNRSEPVYIPMPGDVTAIGGSGNTSCAVVQISGKGKLYCWGNNTQGSVGIGTVSARVVTPTPVVSTGFVNGSNYDATSLSSGADSYNMCTIADGDAYCWGHNEAGQVGDGTNTTRMVPTAVVKAPGKLLNKTVIAITQDGYPCGDDQDICPGDAPFNYFTHTCAVAKPVSGNGEVYCWGENYFGQLGNGVGGTANRSNVPVAVRADPGDELYNKNVQDVIAGTRHSCALANSKVYCWGYNVNGQLGIGTMGGVKSVPQAVVEQTDGLAGKTITAIGGGANRGCAVADFLSYCWGINSNGQIGDGTTIDRSVPTESLFLRPKGQSFVF